MANNASDYGYSIEGQLPGATTKPRDFSDCPSATDPSQPCICHEIAAERGEAHRVVKTGDVIHAGNKAPLFFDNMDFCESCGGNPCTCLTDYDASHPVSDDDEGYPPRCSNPGGHSWVEGEADRGDEGPIRCAYCGADGDA